jgi:hypothetical protein
MARSAAQTATALEIDMAEPAAPVSLTPAPTSTQPVGTSEARTLPTQADAQPLINLPKLQHHVIAISQLVGQPARVLAARLGSAATLGDGTIEWNVSELGVAAGATYGYANIEAGIVTGVVFRGRADLDGLLQLRFPRGIQLTRAGGDRPSFSITVGE